MRLFPIRAAVIVLAAFLSGCSRGTDEGPGPGSALPTATALAGDTGCGAEAEPGTVSRSIEVEGLLRTYRLHVPEGYESGQRTPLVFNFHGFTSTSERQELVTGMNEKADEEGFIVVTPQGLGFPSRWYIFGRNPENPDDVAFTRAMLDEVSDALCIDPDRIYATGMSNGGGMASLLGCEMDEVFAAIAPVAAAPFDLTACGDASPMPVIAFHGTADFILPFEGGTAPIFGFSSRPAREVSRAWAVQNGCDLEVRTERVAEEVVLEAYGGCEEGADVHLYVVEGGGHSWPGEADVPRFLGGTNDAIDATGLIWQFFEDHSKQ